ncbi:MAG: CS1-pili formation C-terminal domain-containing protein, partial [Shewanella oncorhynchi]
SNGSSTILHAGRNFVPLSAFKPGQIQFDFIGQDTPPVVIKPANYGYHYNNGAVGYLNVKAIKTVTVIGQLLDASGQPLRGAQIINHANRSVSESNGFFSLDMSESTPTIEVRHKNGTACNFRLEAGQYRKEGDTLMVGRLSCINPAESAQIRTDVSILKSNSEGS